MKKKLFLGAALALALGAGAVTAAHFSGNGLFGGLAKEDVESLAECEVYEAGVVVSSCVGEEGTCSGTTVGGRHYSCSGKQG